MQLREYLHRAGLADLDSLDGESSAYLPGRYSVERRAEGRRRYDFRLKIDGSVWCWTIARRPRHDRALRAVVLCAGDDCGERDSREDLLAWDEGTWECEGDVRAGYALGRLTLRLSGGRLTGRWLLIRTAAGPGIETGDWILRRCDDPGGLSLGHVGLAALGPTLADLGCCVTGAPVDKRRRWKGSLKRSLAMLRRAAAAEAIGVDATLAERWQP